VAPHRADFEQHGLVLPPSGSERVFTPFVPLDGLVHGGSQVGGRRASEGVVGRSGHDHYSLNAPGELTSAGWNPANFKRAASR